MQDKDKKPLNEQGQRHGHWEIYNCDKLSFKGLFINGKRYGKHETYYASGGIMSTYHYINDALIGYRSFISNISEREYKAYYAR